LADWGFHYCDTYLIYGRRDLLSIARSHAGAFRIANNKRQSGFNKSTHRRRRTRVFLWERRSPLHRQYWRRGGSNDPRERSRKLELYLAIAICDQRDREYADAGGSLVAARRWGRRIRCYQQ